MYLVPADEWGDEEHEAIVRPLDLDRELQRFGGTVNAMTASSNEYCHFFDDEAFDETDRPGFRRRVITGERLQLCFWRIKGGATGSFLHHHPDNEQLGIIVRGALDFRIGEPDDERRTVLHEGDVYLAPGGRLARRLGLHRRRRVRRVLDPRRVRPARERPRMTTSRLAPGGRHRRHVHRRRAARCGLGRGRRREGADDSVGAARRRPPRGHRVAAPRRCASGRHHRADRPRHDADHQRPHRGQGRARRDGRHRRLRRHDADPRRAPLRHVRPADRVPGAADPAGPHVRDRRAGARHRRGATRPLPPPISTPSRRRCVAPRSRP